MKMFNLSEKKSLQLLALSTIMLLSYQNCGPGVLNSANQASEGQTFTVNGTGTGVTDLNEVVDAKAVGISYSENTFTSMLNQTGVAAPSAATRTAVTTQFSKLSETGKADSVTAPMWISITTVAGELCNDLVNQERALAAASRRFYTGIDFAVGPASISAAAKDDVIRRLARSFWGRNETAQEKTLILSSFNGTFTSATAADTQSGAMFLCTAMLSSLDAHKY
ncbi:MAG: hypothetical protein V4760_03045 [Bdellovibrionota bacterium]